jgi:ParB family transcriptional regulator, chromosome partitioning protein
MKKKIGLPNLSEVIMPNLDNLSQSSAALVPSKNIEPKASGEAAMDVVDILIEKIHDNPKNSRKDYNQEELDHLAESIKETGFRGILEVFPHPDRENEFVLVYGHRRKRASILAGEVKLPCVILKEESLSIRKVAFYENFVRVGISIIEQATELNNLKEDYESITNVELAKLSKMSEADVSRLLKVLSFPDAIQVSLHKSEISFGHAKYLLPLLKREDSLLMTAFVKTIEKKWNVRNLKNFIEKSINSEGEGGVVKESDTIEVESVEKLSSKYKTTVSIKDAKNRGGKIELRYSCPEDKQRLLDFLNR